MKAPLLVRSELVLKLPPGEGNPRNSEGDFVRLRDGRILFAYSRYRGESAHDDAACDIAALYSADDGRSFPGEPETLVSAASHGVQNLMSVSLLRLQNGRPALFYLCKREPYSEYYMRLADETETAWGDPIQCLPNGARGYYVVNNARVEQLSDGRLLIPAAKHAVVPQGSGGRHAVYFGTCRIYETDGDGKNPSALSGTLRLPCPLGSATGLQEPGLVQLPDGRLYAYFRTDRMYQYESFSADGGRHWSKPVASRFTSPDSPLHIRRNPYSGLYYAVWNPIPNYNGRLTREARHIHAGRTPLVLAVSENGLDFSDYTVIEDDPAHGYCYPALFFLNENELLLAYCSGGAETGMCLAQTTLRRLLLMHDSL